MSTDKPHKPNNHLLTNRTGVPSLLGSLAKLPSPRRLTINKFIPQNKPCKFNPSRRQLRNTFRNSFNQSLQKHHRSCIRTFREANHEVMNSPQASLRRVRKDGIYKQMSTLQIGSDQLQTLCRSVEDLRVVKNRRGSIALKQTNMPNPISGRAAPPTCQRRHYQNEKRKARDEGERCANTFCWKADRNKSSYGYIHRSKLQTK